MDKREDLVPGPWIAKHSGFGDATVISKPGWTNKDGSAFEPVIIARTSWGNANLISASHDLLKACEEAQAQIDYLIDKLTAKNRRFVIPTTEKCLLTISSAVSKAKGVNHE
jgi:hypothetical protein